MIDFSQTIRYNDPLVPPTDVLSEAVYKGSKLEFWLRGLKGREPSNAIEIADEIVGETERETGDELTTGAHQQPIISRWKLLRVIAGAHNGWVRSLDVDPLTNKWFVTGASDATIKVWDLGSAALKTTITGHIMGVRALCVSKKFPYLFSGSEDKTVRCWDLERTNSQAGCQIRDYHGHLGGIYAMALHPELDILVTGGRDQVVRVWDIRSRTEVMVLTGHRSDISSIITSVSDPQIITSSMDSTIRLWDIRKQKTELSITQHSKSIRALLDHPNEATMCSGDSAGNIKQWVLPQGDLLNEFGTKQGIINSMSINHTNNNLFVGYDDGKMEFFDYVSGKLLQKSHSIPSPGSPESAIYCSQFDLAGLRLITGEGDNSIKIWGEV